jgi:hypothetical protein
VSFTHRGAACQSYSLSSLECLEQDYLKDSAAEPFTFTLEVPLAKEAGGQVAVPDSAEVVEAPTTTVRPQHSLTHSLTLSDPSTHRPTYAPVCVMSMVRVVVRCAAVLWVRGLSGEPPPSHCDRQPRAEGARREVDGATTAGTCSPHTHSHNIQWHALPPLDCLCLHVQEAVVNRLHFFPPPSSKLQRTEPERAAKLGPWERRVHGCLFLNQWDVGVSYNKLKLLQGGAVRGHDVMSCHVM